MGVECFAGEAEDWWSFERGEGCGVHAEVRGPPRCLGEEGAAPPRIRERQGRAQLDEVSEGDELLPRWVDLPRLPLVDGRLLHATREIDLRTVEAAGVEEHGDAVGDDVAGFPAGVCLREGSLVHKAVLEERGATLLHPASTLGRAESTTTSRIRVSKPVEVVHEGSPSASASVARLGSVDRLAGMPTWWEVLTGLVVPVLGVAASTAVAIAALRVSRSATTIAAQARSDAAIATEAAALRDLADRKRAFADSLRAFAAGQADSVTRKATISRKPSELFTSAATLPDTGADRALNWLASSIHRLASVMWVADPSAPPGLRTIPQRRGDIYGRILDSLDVRLTNWVEHPELFDDTPFEHPDLT